jgi:CheY-like chemotaxis protein
MMASIKIMVVEDNPINQKVILTMLKMFKTEVIIANSGEEGLAIFNNHVFDLVLMDFQLPNMNGIETTMMLRKYEAEHSQKKTLIIALTAEVFKDNEINCLSAGMDGFLTKPIRIQTLNNSLRQFGIQLST